MLIYSSIDGERGYPLRHEAYYCDHAEQREILCMQSSVVNGDEKQQTKG